MNSVALDFKSISIRVVCITTVTIAAVFLMLALTGCGPSNENVSNKLSLNLWKLSKLKMKLP